MAIARRGLVLLLALTALGPCCARAASPADVVVVAGQSNALGFGLTPADLPPELRRVDPGVRIWTGKAFETLTPGVNTGTPVNPQAWGPEVAFAHRWRIDHPQDGLYIVKSVKGSTALAATPGPDWAPASHELYDTATRAVAGAKAALTAQGLAPRVRAILWVQGEADAGGRDQAAAYRVNLTALLARMRRDWAARDVPILLARLAPGYPFGAQVRAGQAAAASAKVRLVDADSYPRQDGVHYTGLGQMRLGADLYAAFAHGRADTTVRP